MTPQPQLPLEVLIEIKDEIGLVREQIGALNAKITSLTGNGQPGRVGTLELEVKKHSDEISRWKGAVWIVGSLAASGALGALGVLWQAIHK